MCKFLVKWYKEIGYIKEVASKKLIGGVLMGEAFKAGCARPQAKAKNILDESNAEVVTMRKEKKDMIKVGRPVPNFELSGYHKGEFKQFSLEEFKGKWVLLCFYPGDFTFV